MRSSLPQLRDAGRRHSAILFVVALLAMNGLNALDAQAQPSVAIEAPNEGANVALPFTLNGWAVDLQSTATSGIDSVAIYTGTATAPVLLGYATSEPRPDVATAFQKPGYLNSGYRFTVPTLPAGSQQLGVMVHSAVTNQWYGPYVRNVLVPAAPLAAIDPLQSAVQPIVLRGVSGDPAATSGPGTGIVELWADPAGGGAPVYLGVASTGHYRPDAAAAYGSQFLYAGWEYVARGLPPGPYVFRVRAQSTITSIWGQGLSPSTAVANDPRIFVESPVNNASVTAPVSIVGAAADLASASGTGASLVHVYVRPVGSASQIFAGEAVPNLPRPDLQAFVANNSQFLNIGFRLDGLPIPQGAYDVLTYAYSTVSNAWTVLTTRITVVVPAAAPVLTPPSGEYSSPISVSGVSSTPGATLRFTVDGSDPTEASPSLPASVIVAAPGAGKIRAFAPGYLPSSTTAVAYTFRVAPPVAMPAAGTHEGPVQFSASTSSPGAVIRFTTDGTDPTETSPELSAPVMIGTSISARLRAFRQGWQPSSVIAVNYTITPARPTFTVASGTYTNIQAIAMQSATPNAVIRFTTDGVSDPTLASPVYTAPISPAVATTIRARTYDPLGATSPVSTVSVAYAVADAVLQPPPASYSAGPVYVQIWSETTNATIRYTTDGSAPTASSQTIANGGTVAIDGTTTLLVQPFVPGWPVVNAAGGLYTLKVPAPNVAPESGTYTRPFALSVSPPPNGGIIRYTTDGTPPSDNSFVWAGIANPPNGIYSYTFRAFVPGWTPSDPATYTYEIVDSVAAMPTMTPPPGDHAIGTTVAITSNDPLATIRFTLDGSSPTATSPVYAGPIALSTPTTVRARAFKPSAAPSNVAGGLYRLKLATPTITPTAGTYTSLPSVSATHPMPAATLRYSVDRRDPTDVSPVVPPSCCIPVSHGTTVKVRAFLNSWAPSDAATSTYRLNTVLPPISASVLIPSPSDGSVVAVGSALAVSVTGAALNPSTVRVIRNGSDVTNLFSISGSSLAAGAVVLAGTTVFEISAVDVTGAATGLTVVLVGTPATFTVTARGPSGAVLPGAFVTLTDAATSIPAQYGTTGIDGTATLRAPAGFAGFVTVQLQDHHTYAAPVTGSSIVAVLSAKTENFQRGLAEWSLSYLQETQIRSHIEGIAPWFCRLNCPSADVFGGDSSDNDLLVGSWFSPAYVTASRAFRFEPGSRSATVRYRFFSHVPSGSYRLTVTDPSNGSILADHQTNMASLQAFNQATPGSINLQSIWLSLPVQIPSAATELRITVTLPPDTNPGYTATWLEIDRTQVSGIQLAAPDLRDVHEPNTTIADPLQFISLGQRDAASGQTEIWGSLTFSGTPDRQVSSVFLDVKNATNGAVRVSVPLHQTITGILNVPFPPAGLTTGASRRLFEFTDAQMQTFTNTDEERLALSIRATDSAGMPIVVAGANAKAVTKLADIRPGLARYSLRDTQQCLRENGTPLQWPCRGDAWGRPKVQAALLSASAALAAAPQNAITLLVNDISNINGGSFPTHTSHRRGTHLDLKFAGYEDLDVVVARKIVRVAEALVTAAANQNITLTRILVSYAAGGAFEEELGKLQIAGQPATTYVKRDASSVHDDHFHAEFNVPAP